MKKRGFVPGSLPRQVVKRGGKRGFTPIELMVVIAVLAILASVLLPALNQAREKARQAVCVNNLKQLGIAFRMYVADNNGYFPAISESPGKINWYNVIGPYVGCAIPVNAYDTFNYTGTVFDCPTARRTNNYAEYGLNQHLFLPLPPEASPLDGKPDATYTHAKLSVVERCTTPSSGRCLVADSAGKPALGAWEPYTQPYTPDPLPGTTGYRLCVLHSGGANILFADGHTEWWNKDKIEVNIRHLLEGI